MHKRQHRCTHCGNHADLTVPYPLLEVDGKPVSHLFIQRDALSALSGPGCRVFSVNERPAPD